MPRTEEARKPVSAAVYLRVSSEEQVRKGFSLETQERLCREELDRVYGPGLYVAELYRDDGYPGSWGLYDPERPTGKSRPALTQMRDAFAAGQHQVICAYRLDRIWRRAALADFLAEQFVPHGLERILCVREQVDLSTASGRFQINMMAAAGAFERELLGERVADALRQRREDGYLLHAPYGWRSQRDEEMEPGQKRRGVMPAEDEGEVVERVAEQYLAGRSILSIAQELNDNGVPTARHGKRWNRSTVKAMLLNPAHAGWVALPDGELITGQHNPHRYYELSEYQQICARIERNAQAHPRSAHVPEYLLGGLLRCGHCGHPLNCRRVKRTNRRYYRCSAGTERSADSMCIRNAKPADAMEAVVISHLRGCSADGNVKQLAAQELARLSQDAEEQLRGDIERLETQLAQAWERYGYWSDQHSDGEADAAEFGFHRQRFRENKESIEEALEARRREVLSSEQRAAELAQAHEVLADFNATFDGLTPEQRREMVHLVVDSAQMFHEEDGSTRLVFTTRLGAEVERTIPNLRGGNTKMTIRQMEVYSLWEQGLGRKEIARRLRTGPPNITALLWLGRKRVGAETYAAAYEEVKHEIEQNSDILFISRRQRKRTPDPDKPVLTEQQQRVLRLAGEGMTAQQIADDLGIPAVNTVYVHLMNCRDRLGRTTNDEAAKHAREMGYI